MKMVHSNSCPIVVQRKMGSTSLVHILVHTVDKEGHTMSIGNALRWPHHGPQLSFPLRPFLRYNLYGSDATLARRQERDNEASDIHRVLVGLLVWECVRQSDCIRPCRHDTLYSGVGVGFRRGGGNSHTGASVLGNGTEPVFGALVVANLAVYFLVFFPLFDATSNVWVAEVAIVGLDGLLIRMLTRFDVFRGDDFCPIRWGYAFVVAAVGNVMSYCVGAAMTS